MTYTPVLVDKRTIEVYDPDGTVIETLNWNDNSDDHPDANGWTWGGDHPDAVYDVVVANDVRAALSKNIDPVSSEQK